MTTHITSAVRHRLLTEPPEFNRSDSVRNRTSDPPTSNDSSEQNSDEYRTHSQSSAETNPALPPCSGDRAVHSVHPENPCENPSFRPTKNRIPNDPSAPTTQTKPTTKPKIRADQPNPKCRQPRSDCRG